MASTRQLTTALAAALAMATSCAMAGEKEHTSAPARPPTVSSGHASGGGDARATNVRTDATVPLAAPQPGDYEAYVDEDECG